jgi:hypothetical protein
MRDLDSAGDALFIMAGEPRKSKDGRRGLLPANQSSVGGPHFIFPFFIRSFVHSFISSAFRGAV